MYRHPLEEADPGLFFYAVPTWIPAFAGMTENDSFVFICNCVGDGAPRNILSCWKITAHEIVKLENGHEAETKPISGRYFREGSGSFEIDEACEHVKFSYQIGPRNGLGLLMKVEENGLKEVEQLWIS